MIKKDRKEYMRQWRLKHIEERKEYDKQYCLNHIEERKEKKKKYREEYNLKNKEILKQKRIAHRAEKKKYNDDHREHLDECQRINRTNNIEKYRRKEKNYNLKKNYGINIDQYNDMLKKQKNKCLICHNEFKPMKNTHVDHNHTTGKVRGLLCTKCNSALGYFNDDINILKEAIKYLKDND
jgi:hypothetical protein